MIRETVDDENDTRQTETPWLEWIAAGTGLLVTLAVFGTIGWQAFQGAEDPPAITVAVNAVSPVEGGYRVSFQARNIAGLAAAQVEIEGRLDIGQGGTETDHVILNYIPAHSERKGGLFFTQDPRTNHLTVRATGFARP